MIKWKIVFPKSFSKIQTSNPNKTKKIAFSYQNRGKLARFLGLTREKVVDK